MTETLTSEQVERYRHDGFVSPIAVLSAERVGILRQQYDRFRERLGSEADTVFRTKPHLVLPWLYDLVQDPAITGPASALLGSDLLVWGSSFFSKSAGDPSFVSWHQDANYWGLEPHEVLTAWIAFTPSRRENGCMRMVPGTHKGPAFAHRDTYDENNLLSRGQEIAVDIDESDAVDIVLEPGEMSLHHVGIVHGSEPNSSTMPRIGYAIRFIATHVRQVGGRTTATLAAGTDRFDHFDQEKRPDAEYDPTSQASRLDALARQHRILYAGAPEDSGRIRVRSDDAR